MQLLVGNLTDRFQLFWLGMLRNHLSFNALVAGEQGWMIVVPPEGQEDYVGGRGPCSRPPVTSRI